MNVGFNIMCFCLEKIFMSMFGFTAARHNRMIEQSFGGKTPTVPDKIIEIMKGVVFLYK